MTKHEHEHVSKTTTKLEKLEIYKIGKNSPTQTIMTRNLRKKIRWKIKYRTQNTEEHGEKQTNQRITEPTTIRQYSRPPTRLVTSDKSYRAVTAIKSRITGGAEHTSIKIFTNEHMSINQINIEDIANRASKLTEEEIKQIIGNNRSIQIDKQEFNRKIIILNSRLGANDIEKMFTETITKQGTSIRSEEEKYKVIITCETEEEAIEAKRLADARNETDAFISLMGESIQEKQLLRTTIQFTYEDADKLNCFNDEDAYELARSQGAFKIYRHKGDGKWIQFVTNKAVEDVQLDQYPGNKGALVKIAKFNFNPSIGESEYKLISFTVPSKATPEGIIDAFKKFKVPIDIEAVRIMETRRKGLKMMELNAASIKDWNLAVICKIPYPDSSVFISCMESKWDRNKAPTEKETFKASLPQDQRTVDAMENIRTELAAMAKQQKETNENVNKIQQEVKENKKLHDEAMNVQEKETRMVMEVVQKGQQQMQSNNQELKGLILAFMQNNTGGNEATAGNDVDMTETNEKKTKKTRKEVIENPKKKQRILEFAVDKK